MTEIATPDGSGSNIGLGPADKAGLPFAGWLLDADTKHERAIAGSGWAPSMGGMTAEPLVLRSDALAAIENAVAAERERWAERVRTMCAVDVRVGAGFYGDDAWIEAYKDLADMAGVECGY